MTDSAPLVSSHLAPVPAGAQAAWFTGAGGGQLRAALFHPEGPARGSVILSGGRTEPIEKYFETIEDFRTRGFVVLAHDWRGQGLSARLLGDRLKGHAKGYETFLGDFKALLDTYQDRLPKPWIAVGHSMGGCLTLLALAEGERRISAAVLSAPMLGLRTGAVPIGRARTMAALQVLLGRAARYVQGDPGKPFDTDFEANRLTHDRARFERTCSLIAAEPDLALGAPTWGWLDFAFKATAYLARPERLRHVTIPVIILSADEEALVDNAAQAAAARHLPQGKLIRVPGAYHEILMETDEMRNIFLRAFDAVTGRVASKPASTAKPPEAPKAAAPAAAAATPQPTPTPAPAAAPATSSSTGDKPMATATAAKKPAAPKAAAPKAAAKKPAAKTAAKPAAAKKPGAAKAAAPKAAAKPAAKKPVAKAAAKPAAAKKPAAAAKKPAAPKAAAKPAAAKKPAAAAKKPVAAKAAAPKTAAKPAAKPAAKAAAKPAAAKKPALAKAAAVKKAPSVKKPAAAKKPAAKKK